MIENMRDVKNAELGDSGQSAPWYSITTSDGRSLEITKNCRVEDHQSGCPDDCSISAGDGAYFVKVVKSDGKSYQGISMSEDEMLEFFMAFADVRRYVTGEGL